MNEVRYRLEEIEPIAKEVRDLLVPHCRPGYCMIAGSIRRRKKLIKDIEIVCIPNPYDIGLFKSGIATVIQDWKKVRGELGKKCKQTTRIVPASIVKDDSVIIKLDLFLVNLKNWGLQIAIRTGNSKFSIGLMESLKRQGLRSEGGYITRGGKPIAVESEKDFFKLCNRQYIKPQLREWR